MSDRSFLAEACGPVMKIGAVRRKFVDAEACSAYISRMEKLGRQPYSLPRTVARSGRVTEGCFEDVQCFTVSPPESAEPADTPPRRVLYLHGGSYFAPPRILHWEMLLRLSELTGAVFDLPIYPRAPLRTCSAAYRLLEDMLLTREYDIIMGDSAGGGLALGLAQTPGGAAPRRLILLSPWLDGALSNPDIAEYEPLDPILASYGLRRMAKLWAGSLDVNDPRVSPINGDMSAVGELTMLVGTHEIFYPDVMKLSDMLAAAGKPCRVIVGEGMNHVWCSYPMKEGREALDNIAEIILSEPM